MKLPPLEPQHRVFERPGTFLQREATREMLRAAAEALSWLAAKDEAELSTMRSQSSSWFQIQVWSRARGSGRVGASSHLVPLSHPSRHASLLSRIPPSGLPDQLPDYGDYAGAELEPREGPWGGGPDRGLSAAAATAGDRGFSGDTGE